MSERPQYLSAEERRAATVQAVVDLAAEQNPADITTTAIADRMGLTQGALFRHFPNKDAILEATMTWVGERLLVRVDKAAEGAKSPAAALEAMFMAHIDFVAKHPGVPRMLFGKVQGELDADLNVDAAAVLFIGTIQGLVMQSLLAGKVSRIRRDAPGVFAIYRRGIESTK